MPPRTPQGIRTWTLCPSSCSLWNDPQNWPLNWPQKLVSATFAAAVWRLLWRASCWPRPAVGLWLSLSLSPPLSSQRRLSLSLTLHADLSCDLHVWMAAPQGALYECFSHEYVLAVVLPFWRYPPHTLITCVCPMLELAKARAINCAQRALNASDQKLAQKFFSRNFITVQKKTKKIHRQQQQIQKSSSLISF